MFHFDSRGDKSPFFYSYIKKNIVILLFLLLLVNHLMASVIDLFDLEKHFSVPGDENDLKSEFLFFIIITGVIAPTIEEFLFRFWILENNKKLIISFILLVSYLILIDFHWIFNSSLIILFICLRIFTTKFPSKHLYISALNGVVFSFFHITNYPSNELMSSIQYLPILLFPQFILGFFTTNLKIHYGFKFSVLYHVLYNSSIIIFVYLNL